MNLIIFSNEIYEEEKALVDLDTKKILLKGDWYHDKIDHLIDGYLMALEDLNLCVLDDVPEQWIDDTHEYFKILEFYNSSY